jgi:hypothetical protein
VSRCLGIWSAPRSRPPANFNHRGGQWADRIASGASVRYDITYDPARGRWYLDASWSTATKGQTAAIPALETLRQNPVLAVDVNADHLAAWIIDPHGNPVGSPHTIPLELSGLPPPPATPGCARRSPGSCTSRSGMSARRW